MHTKTQKMKELKNLGHVSLSSDSDVASADRMLEGFDTLLASYVMYLDTITPFLSRSTNSMPFGVAEATVVVVW